MKKDFYVEARLVAEEAKFPQEIVCEIVKEHADKLFHRKQYGRAID